MWSWKRGLLYRSNSTCRWSMVDVFIRPDKRLAGYFVDYPAMMMFNHLQCRILVLHQGHQNHFLVCSNPSVDSLLSNVNIIYLLPNLIAQSARDPIPTPPPACPSPSSCTANNRLYSATGAPERFETLGTPPILQSI